MKLAQRVTSIAPSPTLAVNAKAAELRAKGVDIISFGVGEPDFDTPAHVRQAGIEAIEGGFTRYTPADGIPELKQAVVDKFKRDNGLDYTTDQVIINCGGKHSGYLVMQALLDPGDEVIIPAPYWVSYPPMVILAGGKPVILPTRQEDDFKLKPEALKEALTERTKAVIINSPSNPTGSVYTAEELRPLAEICAQAGVLIMSDEIYETILFDGLTFTATASLSPEIYEHTVTLNGVSKAYAMTGWRIGYMAGPVDLIKACAKIQSQSTSNPCSIAQKAAVAALTGPQDAVDAMNQQFAKRRDYIMQRLLEIEGITCPRPQGAFYAMPNLSAYYGKSYAGGKTINGSVDMSAYLLEEGHIATVAGAAFGEDSCVRFSFATSLELIEKGMDRLQAALAKLS
jgi:aspartate aminotransferase